MQLGTCNKKGKGRTAVPDEQVSCALKAMEGGIVQRCVARRVESVDIDSSLIFEELAEFAGLTKCGIFEQLVRGLCKSIPGLKLGLVLAQPDLS